MSDVPWRHESKLSDTGAGIVLDMCAAHGTFFDVGELHRIVEFSPSWTRDLVPKPPPVPDDIEREADGRHKDPRDEQFSILEWLFTNVLGNPPSDK